METNNLSSTFKALQMFYRTVFVVSCSVFVLLYGLISLIGWISK